MGPKNRKFPSHQIQAIKEHLYILYLPSSFSEAEEECRVCLLALGNQRRTQSQGASANFIRAVGEFRDCMHLLALQGKGRVQKWSPQVLPTLKKLPTSSFPSSRLFIIIKWISFVYRFWCFSNCCSRTRPQGNRVYVQPLSEQCLSSLQSFVSSRHIPHCIQSQMFWRFASTEVPSFEVPNVGHQPLISQVNAPDFWVPYQSCITTLGIGLLERQYLCLSCLSWYGPYSYLGGVVQLVFRTFSEENDLYVAVDSVGPWEEVSLVSSYTVI